MRALRHIAFAALALVGMLGVTSLSPGSAQAQTFPALSGRVVDQAGVLDPGVGAMLTSKLAALEDKTSDQVVVATVKSLQGYSVEDYATRLFRHWRLGQKDTNNGVLLLVAPTERKVRIEVGYGLEGTLTDAVAKLIIEQSMVPRFRANDFAGGIVRASEDIVSVLTGDAEEWQRRAAPLRSNSHVHDVGVINLPPVLGFVLAALVYGFGGLMAAFVAYLVVFLLARFMIFAHVLPQRKKRTGYWLWLNMFDDDKYDSRGRRVSGHAYASGPSGSSDSFSGGGGSSGGGGASGSW
jgi:uncharacterized protein